MKKNSSNSKILVLIITAYIIAMMFFMMFFNNPLLFFVPIAIIGIIIWIIVLKEETSGSSATSNSTESTSFVDNFIQNLNETSDTKIISTDIAKTTDYNQIYNLSETELVETFLKKEMEKAGISQNSNLMPTEIFKRKKTLCSIFSALLFTYISLIFFHFPIITYIVGIIILIILHKKTKDYDIVKYLTKEIKARPDEKISNIVMASKNDMVADTYKKTKTIMNLVAFFLPLIIFMTPHIMYEKTTNGYNVRFYTFGLTNMTSAIIPSTHNGENVVGLRGNTFSNMPFLRKVILPDTIKEIRGQVFKNDFSLNTVNIPKNLEYLGGGAFYNCTSITSIVLPDTLTHLGGESFKNAGSLETIKLSENMTEIRGNTFENCISLKEIDIPDKVTRIGGHAFYGDTSLRTVTLTENSQLKEIGSSAFRLCTNLYSITIPIGTSVNERAFKESPTHINYFEMGKKSKNGYLSLESLPMEIETENYGNIFIKVDNVEYISYNYWSVQLSLTGGLNQSVGFSNYRNPIYMKDDFKITILNCNSDGKIEIEVTYN